MDGKTEIVIKPNPKWHFVDFRETWKRCRGQFFYGPGGRYRLIRGCADPSVTGMVSHPLRPWSAAKLARNLLSLLSGLGSAQQRQAPAKVRKLSPDGA